METKSIPAEPKPENLPAHRLKNLKRNISRRNKIPLLRRDASRLPAILK